MLLLLIYLFITVVSKEIVFEAQSTSPDLFIQAVSDSKIYVSNLKKYLIFDVYQEKTISPFWVTSEKAVGSLYPRFYFDSAGEPISFYTVENQYMQVFVYSSFTIYTLDFLSQSEFLSLDKITDDSYFFASCVPSTGVMIIGVFYTNYTLLYSRYKKICSKAIAVGVTMNNVFFSISKHTSCAGLQYQTWSENLSKLNMNLLSTNCITSISSTNIGRIQFIHLQTNELYICAFLPDTETIECFEFNINTKVASTSVQILSNCPSNYEDYFIFRKLTDTIQIVGCQGDSFQIQLMQYDSTKSIFIRLAEVTNIQESNAVYYDFDVLTDYKLVLVAVKPNDTGYIYNYFLMGFGIGADGSDYVQVDKYYPKYLDTADNLWKDCHSTCFRCVQEGDDINNNCLSCLEGTYPFEDKQSNCAAIGDEGPDYIFNEIILMFSYCLLNFFIDNGQFYCSNCFGNYPYVIPSLRKCVASCPDYKLLLYINECVENCPSGTFKLYNEICELFRNAQNELITFNHKVQSIFDNIDDNVIKLSEDSSILKGYDYTLQVYTTDLPLQEIPGLSTLYLDNYEDAIKKAFGLAEDSKLIVAKIDIVEPNSIIPKVEYFIYDEKGNKLDLSLLDKTETVTISYPI